MRPRTITVGARRTFGAGLGPMFHIVMGAYSSGICRRSVLWDPGRIDHEVQQHNKVALSPEFLLKSSFPTNSAGCSLTQPQLCYPAHSLSEGKGRKGKGMKTV